MRTHISYANVVATLSLFLALGGTSYAVLRIGSDNVIDNSLRSRDVRNNSLHSRDLRNRSIRARDVRTGSLGGKVIDESSLGPVPKAANADRVGGSTLQDLKVDCPPDTASKAGVCVETASRSADDFITAVSQCDQAGRGLVTMPQLDTYVRSSGPLQQAEWTGSVYRNPNGPTAVEQLEAVVLQGGGDVTYDRVHAPIQHAFRCVALPSN
jgi:hypothetical protein